MSDRSDLSDRSDVCTAPGEKTPFQWQESRDSLSWVMPFPKLLRDRFFPGALFLAALLISNGALAGDGLPLKVVDAWVRAVPPSLTDTAAFMRLQNTGDAPLRLTGGSTPIAGMAMPMGTTRKMVQGVEVLGMRGVDFIEIPAHGEAVLKPGGDHLMLMNLTAHPRPGEMVAVTLEVEPGHRKLTVEMPARVDGDVDGR